MKPFAQPAKPDASTKAAKLRALLAETAAPSMMGELYRRAAAQLRKRRKNPRSKPAVPKSAAGPQRLLHELQVHQVELEMQNSELQEARDRMETLLEKYADLYDFAPVGYFTLDEQGVILEVNLMGAALLGLERSRLINRPLPRFVAPASQPVLLAFLKRVFAGTGKEFCEAELLPGAAAACWAAFHGTLALSVSAPRKWCRVAVSDITSLKEAENKVRVSEVRFRRLFEASYDGILLVDPETRKITDANPFMTKLLGYPHTRLVGRELFEIGLLKDETASQEMFRKLKREHKVRYEDLPLESQAGRHQEVEVMANLYQENGHAVIQCNIRDITERKHAEEMLRRSEALFSSLIEEAPYGVYVVDLQLRLQQVNRVALPVFKNVRPLIGRGFSEVLRVIWPPQVAGQIVKHFRHTLKTGAPYRSPDFAGRRRDSGVKEFYEWQIQRITLTGGEHGVVCFFNNVTERKQAEAAQHRLAVLAASNRKLEQEILRRQAVEQSLRQSQQHQIQLSERARKLSHQILHAQEEERKRISRELHDEIVQTLVGINVRLATLTREATDSSIGFRRNIARAQRLVEQSVDKVHRFARELRPTSLDDLGLIPALEAFLKEFTRRTGVRARLTAFAAIEQLKINKRTVLYRVAHEALNNVACHAQASRVEVSIEKLRDTVCMKIKDNGKSFDVGRALLPKRHGRLGLLGMRERLEMVGGRLAIESAPRKGTTVEAQIPLERPARGGGGGGDGVR